MNESIEQTLSIIKPDAVERNLRKDIIPSNGLAHRMPRRTREPSSMMYKKYSDMYNF